MLEEAVSFFDARLIFRVYFSCAVAYYALQIMIQGHSLVAKDFTEYDIQVHCDVGYFAEDLVMFGVLGAIGGVFGALFNRLVLFFARIRKQHVSHLGYRRMFDAILICILTSLFIVFVPLGYPCSSPRNIVSHVDE